MAGSGENSKMERIIAILERNVNLDLQQKALLEEERKKLDLREKKLQTAESAQNAKFERVLTVMERNLNLDLAQKAIFEEERWKLQKEFEEFKQQLDETNQQLKQEKELKDLLKQFGDKLDHIENKFDDIRRITNSLERAVFVGSYDKWPYSDSNELYLIPLTKVKKIISEIDNLEVNIKSQWEQGIASVQELLSATEIISVSRNRRFPSNAEDYFCVRSDKWNIQKSFLHRLRRDLEKIDNIGTDINYRQSKTVIFEKCTQMIENEGWKKASKHYSSMPGTTPTLLLDKYLWTLCCLVNFDKLNDNLTGGGVYNVNSFEGKRSVVWK